MVAGQLNCGNSLSTTVTVKVLVFVLPWMSVTVFVTVVVPTGNKLPLAGVLVTVFVPQLSVAVTLKVTLLPHAPLAAFTVMFAGVLITGNWLSTTVTVKLHTLELPSASTTLKVFNVVPTGNDAPLARPASRFVATTPQLSLAPME